MKKKSAGYYETENYKVIRAECGFWDLVRKGNADNSECWCQRFATKREAAEAAAECEE